MRGPSTSVGMTLLCCGCDRTGNECARQRIRGLKKANDLKIENRQSKFENSSAALVAAARKTAATIRPNQNRVYNARSETTATVALRSLALPMK